ncbi:MAG: hypothetical protein PHQ12_03165 [Chthoniobacteraceae bacterium]|nr:hypothetical protein [Chthoniobacteraceae bacterium]
MKTPFILLAAALLSGVLPVRAEEAVSDKNLLGPVQDIGTLQPPAAAPASLFPSAPANGAPAPAPSPEPQLAVPETQPTPLPSPAASPDTSKKGSIEQLRQAVRIRELKTVAEEDPQVQEEKAKASLTKTAEGRRILMRNYYTLLYTKMEKLDPSLKEPLELQLHDTLRNYEQHLVYPSVLIENVTALPGSCSADHAAPGASPDATPKPSKKKAKRF